jgi:ribose transport system substrate-binding protein
MHRTRRWLLQAVAIGLAGFATNAASAAEPTIALVQINQQALFFNQMNEGAKQAADKVGAKLVIFNANMTRPPRTTRSRPTPHRK